MADEQKTWAKAVTDAKKLDKRVKLPQACEQADAAVQALEKACAAIVKEMVSAGSAFRGWASFNGKLTSAITKDSFGLDPKKDKALIDKVRGILISASERINNRAVGLEKALPRDPK